MNKAIQYQQRNIFYRATGTGNPVILVHGFAEDGEIWNNQVTALKDHYRLIIPDLPGSGRSAMIEDMSMEGMAEVIHAIIHEEGIESCPVIGHSMGGYITLALVEKYWNHVSAFGLFHSTAFADSEEKKANRRKGIAFINEHGAGAFLKTTIPNLFSPASREQQPGMMDELLAGADNFSADALVSYYQAMLQRPDRTALLKKTKVPVLFIGGKYDTAVPVEDMLKQCHLPEKSYFHLLLQTGHMGMLEEPPRSNEFLDKFLREI